MNGIWRIHPSTLITELISKDEFDFQIFDREHGGYDFSSLTEDIRVCKLLKSKAYVRVSGLNQVEVQRCLDLGADGIIFPQLSTIEDFTIASKMIFPYPSGTRGYNPFVYDFDFGSKLIPSKKECITIIETLEAIDNLEQIVKIPNLNTFYIGIYDISAQLNCIGELKNQKVTSAVDKIIQILKTNNKSISLMTMSHEDYQYYSKKGVNDFVYGVDSFYLKKAFTNIKNT